MIHFHLEIKVSTEQQQRDDGKSLGKRERRRRRKSFVGKMGTGLEVFFTL